MPPSKSIVANFPLAGPPAGPAAGLLAGIRHTRLSRRAILFVLALISVPLYAARNPEPPQRVSLKPFGFQTISERYLLQGATMLTVDFVDNGHLLVTFGISRLMPRLADCPTDDEDRTVKAVLLELPSGKELASTEWRFHDLGQYLWNLGDGHFLLRNRDTLTTFTPLRNLPANPFVPTPFLHFSRRIEAIIVSADRDLLAIETVKHKPHGAIDPMLQVSTQVSSQVSTQPSPTANTPNPASASSPHPPGLLRREPTAATPDPQPVEITFLRLQHAGPAESHALSSSELQTSASPTRITAQILARIRTDKVVTIPLTTEGFLETRADSRDGVLFHFITYTGKDLDLGDFPTSCHPRPTFISHSEFVTYGCRGADESLDLAGFNLRGDMIWQINFTDQQAYPSFASAPAAGRFAFSRTITTSNVFGSETPSASQLTAQEIRVVQMYNGKQLVRAVASPIQRAGQNYALSPDGLTLAVMHDTPAPPLARGEKPIHDTAIELFKLPALSPQDLAGLKTEAAMAPPPSEVPMRFSMKEIKEGLNPKPGSSDADAKIVGDRIQPDVPSSEPLASRSPDAHIVGDPAPTDSAKQAQAATSNANSTSAASSKSALIPTADSAPACADLTETSPAACPVPSRQAPAASLKSNPVTSSGDGEPEKRRKPPTLYEPAPPDVPKQPQP